MSTRRLMAEYWTNGMATLYQADARELPLADKSVHCAVTSPPYWGLREYQLGDAGIGLEPTLGEWVTNIVAVGREVWRVLRDDGTWWLNLGDAYSGSGKHSADHANPGISKAGDRGGDIATHPQSAGLPPKNLMGQPWRAAFALQDDGWILRSAIVWHKPNPMPESVRDRPTNAYDMVFLLSKQGRYFYDAEAIRQPSITGDMRRPYGSEGAWQMDGRADDMKHGGEQRNGPSAGANARNLWTIPTQGRSDAHFATFPDELPRRCIMAGTSERGVCAECGAPWVRRTETNRDGAKTKISVERATVDKEAIAEYLRKYRMALGLSKAQVNAALGTVAMYSWFEGRLAGIEVPTVEKWAKLKDILHLGDDFDDAIAATIDVVRTDAGESRGAGVRSYKSAWNAHTQTLGWQPTCGCNGDVVPATVLDPFVGSGTTLAVAQSLGRRSVGTDLNTEYLEIARRYISRADGITLPMGL